MVLGVRLDALLMLLLLSFGLVVMLGAFLFFARAFIPLLIKAIFDRETSVREFDSKSLGSTPNRAARIVNWIQLAALVLASAAGVGMIFQEILDLLSRV